MKKITSILTLILLSFILIACGPKYVTVKFYVNGGNPIEDLVIEQGKDYELPVATKTGHTFDGWYEDEALEKEHVEGKSIVRNYSLYAKWVINQYELKFKISDTEFYVLNQDYNTPLTYPEEPVKEGFNFAGWYEDQNLTKVFNKQLMPANNLTLYPKFTAEKFEVTFMIDDTVHARKSVEYGKVIDSIPALPSRVGYNAKWNIDLTTLEIKEDLVVEAIYTLKVYTVQIKDQQGNIYATLNINHGEKVVIENDPEKLGHTFVGYSEDLDTFVVTKDTEIIAHFDRIKYNVVFYDKNGTPVRTLQVSYGDNATAPDLDQVDGFTFIGWNQTLTNITANLNVNPIYEANTYVITLDTKSDLVLPNINQKYQTEVNLPTPTKTGYTFVAWVNLSTGQIVSNKTTMPLNGMNLYATYSPINYTITYHNLFGSVANNDVNYTIVSADIALDNPSGRTHYIFAGWFLDEAFENQITVIPTGTHGNLSIYAKWELVKYNVNFNIDGVITTKQITYGTQISESDIPTIPSKIHYDQTTPTWNTNPLGVTVNGDLAFNAVYTANTYTITFDSQGGSLVNAVSGKYLTSIPEILAPNKEQATFGGWYTDTTFTTSYDLDTFKGNVTVYAKWTNYASITFNTNGGSPINQISEAPGAIITLPINTTKYGHTFAGWYLDQSLETPYTEVLMPSESITLYAKWEKVTFTVTFILFNEVITRTYLYESFIEALDFEILSRPNYDNEDPTWDSDPIGAQVLGNMTFEMIYIPNEMNVSLHTGDQLLENQLTVPYDTKLNQSDIIAPTKAGYVFVRWYKDSNLLERYNFNDPVTSDITLYAQWQRVFYSAEIESIFEKEDLNTEGVFTEEFRETQILNDLYYNQIINVINVNQHYAFSKIVINGETFVNIDHAIVILGNMTGEMRIQVYYTKIIYQLVFVQDPELFPNQIELATQVFRVYSGDKFENIPSLAQKPGYTAYWDRVLFENVTSDLTINAQYLSQSTITIRFVDSGMIRYIAEKLENETVAIDENSLLWSLTKEGYTFAGWYETEDYSDEGYHDGQILFKSTSYVLYAKWNKLPAFEKPSDIEISSDEETITITWTLNPSLINGLRPSHFMISVDYNLVFVLADRVQLQGNIYTLTLTIEDITGEDEAFLALTEAGLHYVTIQAIGDNINHYEGLVSNVKSYSKESIFEQDPTEVAVYDNFIIESFMQDGKETKRYVFFPSLTYVFNLDYTFEIVSGDEVASADLNILTTKDITGSFKFRLTKLNETPVIYDAIVVQSLTQFTHGSNYQNYLDRNSNSTYLDKSNDDPYYVGVNNAHYFDLRMLNAKGVRVSLNDIQLTYKFELFIDNNYVELDEVNFDDYVKLQSNNRFKLTEEAIGKSFRVTILPKYQGAKRQVEPLVFEFNAVDGYNAYTHNELKSLYNNINIQTIILHANIEAQLTTDQLNDDGSPINLRATSANSITGNVYTRFDRNTNSDNLVIHGNFMTINGSNLPYMNIDSGSGGIPYTPYPVVNVQIGIFVYDVINPTLLHSEATSTVDLVYLNNNKLTMNNLQIIGNTRTPQINYGGTPEEVLAQEQLMLRNSGGMLGIFQIEGSIDLQNVQIGFTTIALSYGGSGVTSSENPEANRVGANLNYFRTYDNWANSMYMNIAPRVEIRNSEIGSSGGAAIHIVDRLKGNGINNPELILHESTIVSNKVSGDEGWFKAYGISPMALQLKGSINTGIADTGRTIIDVVNNPVTGLSSEMMNFIILTEASESAKSYANTEGTDQNGGSEVNLILVDNNIQATEIKRSWNYLTSSNDPRIIPSDPRSFVFPIGTYSEFVDFYTLLTQVGGDANTASYLAFQGLKTDMTVVYRPKYLEVMTTIPLFTNGSSQIILELY